jgi:hypothetical protein
VLGEGREHSSLCGARLLAHELSAAWPGPVAVYEYPARVRPLTSMLEFLLAQRTAPPPPPSKVTLYCDPRRILDAESLRAGEWREMDVSRPFLKSVPPLHRAMTRRYALRSSPTAAEPLARGSTELNQQRLERARRELETLSDTEREGARSAIEFVEALLRDAKRDE